MDILYKIKCELPLNISWERFLPLHPKDWIEIKITDKIIVKIGVTGEIASLYFKVDPIDVSSTIFPIESIMLEINGYWPEEIAELLKTPSEEKESLITFRKDIRDAIEKIYINLVKNIRDHFGQWWLPERSPYLPLEENAISDALWLDSDGEWKRIFPKIIVLKSDIHTFGITEGNWQQLGERLKNNTPIDMIETMMANAKSHLDNENGRLAIVESVCALEATIKQDIPPLLSEVVKPPIPDNLLESAIEKMGLRLTARIFFEHVSEKFHLDPRSCEKCLDAIDRRNEIIHKKRHTIALTDARQYVVAIDQIIRSLNNFE